jgi:hypothetical protein
MISWISLERSNIPTRVSPVYRIGVTWVSSRYHPRNGLVVRRGRSSKSTKGKHVTRAALRRSRRGAWWSSTLAAAREAIRANRTNGSRSHWRQAMSGDRVIFLRMIRTLSRRRGRRRRSDCLNVLAMSFCARAWRRSASVGSSFSNPLRKCLWHCTRAFSNRIRSVFFGGLCTAGRPGCVKLCMASTFSVKERRLCNLESVSTWSSFSTFWWNVSAPSWASIFSVKDWRFSNLRCSMSTWPGFSNFWNASVPVFDTKAEAIAGFNMTKIQELHDWWDPDVERNVWRRDTTECRQLTPTAMTAKDRTGPELPLNNIRHALNFIQVRSSLSTRFSWNQSWTCKSTLILLLSCLLQLAVTKIQCQPCN